MRSGFNCPPNQRLFGLATKRPQSASHLCDALSERHDTGHLTGAPVKTSGAKLRASIWQQAAKILQLQLQIISRLFVRKIQYPSQNLQNQSIDYSPYCGQPFPSDLEISKLSLPSFVSVRLRKYDPFA